MDLSLANRSALASLAALLIAMTADGCTAGPCRFDSDKKAERDFCSQRLTTAVENPYRDFQLQVFCTANGRRGYLCLHSIPLQVESGIVVDVKAAIGNECLVIHTVALEGGQRLLLDDDTTSLLLMTMQNGGTVHLSLGRYNAPLKLSQETVWERCLLRHKI